MVVAIAGFWVSSYAMKKDVTKLYQPLPLLKIVINFIKSDLEESTSLKRELPLIDRLPQEISYKVLADFLLESFKGNLCVKAIEEVGYCAQSGDIQFCQMSPTENHIAMVVTERARTKIAILDTTTHLNKQGIFFNELPQVFLGKEGERPLSLSHLQFSPDEQHIAWDEGSHITVAPVDLCEPFIHIKKDSEKKVSEHTSILDDKWFLRAAHGCGDDTTKETSRHAPLNVLRDKDFVIIAAAGTHLNKVNCSGFRWIPKKLGYIYWYSDTLRIQEAPEQLSIGIKNLRPAHLLALKYNIHKSKFHKEIPGDVKKLADEAIKENIF